MSSLGFANAPSGFPPGTDVTPAEALFADENISDAVFDRSYWSSDLQLWVIYYTAASTPSVLIWATEAGLTTNRFSTWQLSNSVVGNVALSTTATSQTYDLLTSKDPSILGTQLTLVVDGSSLNFPTIDGSLAVNNPNTSSVSLLGDLVQDHVVTLSNTLTDIDGLNALSYVWQTASSPSATEGNWTSIDGATSAQYIPTANEASLFLRAKLTYADGLGYQETVISQVSSSAVIANQAPTIEDQTVYSAKGEVYTFKLSDFGFADADAGDTLSAISLLNLPTTGGLTLNHNLLEIPEGGGFSITMTQLEAGFLQFTPSTNLPTPLSENLSYLVIDSHLTASADPGHLNLADSTRPISNNSQIDGTVGTPIDIRPDAFYFSDSDIEDFFQSITITQLPVHGQLNLGGVAVELNQTISWEDMYDLGFSFTPNGSSSSYEHLKFKVSDGKVTSSSAYDLQFNITDPDNPSGGVDISGQVHHWKGLTPVPVSGVSIAIGPNASVNTDPTGLFTLAGADLSNGSQVSPSVAAPFANKTDAGITLTDVLATLKVYLGRDLPADYASPFNVVAADFDANGVVNLSDVLGLLKYYLGRTSVGAPVPTWAFVNATDVTSDGQHIVGANGSQLNKSYVTLDPVSLAADPTTPVTLIGVVRGDVDGSWAALPHTII